MTQLDSLLATLVGPIVQRGALINVSGSEGAPLDTEEDATEFMQFWADDGTAVVSADEEIEVTAALAFGLDSSTAPQSVSPEAEADTSDSQMPDIEPAPVVLAATAVAPIAALPPPDKAMQPTSVIASTVLLRSMPTQQPPMPQLADSPSGKQAAPDKAIQPTSVIASTVLSRSTPTQPPMPQLADIPSDKKAVPDKAIQPTSLIASTILSQSMPTQPPMPQTADIPIEKQAALVTPIRQSVEPMAKSEHPMLAVSAAPVMTDQRPKVAGWSSLATDDIAAGTPRQTVPTPNITAPPTAPNLLLPPLALGGSKSLLTDGHAPPDELFAIEPRTATTTAASPSQVAAPPYARSVVQQIATAIVQTTGSTTQIALNPEELGSVRIALSHSDAGLIVSIMAERPETADLMRRHLDQLARDLRDLGYDNPTFTFDDQSGDAPDQNDSSGESISTPETALLDTPQSPAMRVAVSSGLDLKL